MYRQAKTSVIMTAAAVLLAAGALLVFSAASSAAAGPGVMLTWKAPGDVASSELKGYRVYRSTAVSGHYDRVAEIAAGTLVFEDRGGDEAAPGGLERGRMYFYRVTTVFASGSESSPTDPVGMTAGGSPDSTEYTLPAIKSFTSDALGKVSYLGETMTFLLDGSPGLSAHFSITGVEGEFEMAEVKPGTYRGEYVVPADAVTGGAMASARIEDTQGGKAYAQTPPSLNMLGWNRPELSGFYAGMVEADRVGLNWPRYEDTGGGIVIFRATAPVVGTGSSLPLTNIGSGGVTAYTDTTVSAGTTYYYMLGLLDDAGLLAAYTDNLKVVVPAAGKVSGIEYVSEDSAGRTLVPGDILNVAIASAPGGSAAFSLGDAAKDVAMTESEPGVYKGSYTVREGDGVFRSKVSASLRDPDGKSRFSSSATFVSLNAPRSDAGSAAGFGPRPVAKSISDNIPSVLGRSGRLTAGKTFTVTMTGDPGMKAYFSVGESIWKVPMNEQPDQPGTYTGEYTVRAGDNAGTSGDPLNQVFVTGYLESASGAQSEPVRGFIPVVVDTTCDIAVEVAENVLTADSASRTKVVFTVTDADGEPVRDRRLTVMLEPPPRYTGVAGGGGVGVFDINSQEAAKDLGTIDVDFDDLTDFSGRVSATYTSGFAAKTAMIVARDYATGSLGMGYVTTVLTSSVSISLEAPKAAFLTMSAGAPAYQLKLEIIPEATIPAAWLARFAAGGTQNALTADGRSRATVIATLTQDGLPVEGKRIIFAVSGASGDLTSSGAVTDGSGRAQVFYIAGRKVGTSIVTATEPETGVSDSGAIMLLADAPAKIYVSAAPESMPADGVSVSEITVGVTDVNNNPTEGIRLNYDISAGSGMLSDSETVTGPDGGSKVYYTAGTAPGVATITVTAASEPPTQEELDNAATTVSAPMVYDYNDRTELRVLNWYVSIGDRVGRGEPLALVDTPDGEMKVYSPVTGTLDRITVDPGIYVMEGREIGKVAR